MQNKLLFLVLCNIYLFIYFYIRRANARNVRPYYPYWQYTDLFVKLDISICISTLPTQHTPYM